MIPTISPVFKFFVCPPPPPIPAAASTTTTDGEEVALTLTTARKINADDAVGKTEALKSALKVISVNIGDDD